MSVCLLPHSEKKTESLKFLCRALNLLFSSALSRPSLSCLSDRLLFIHICGAAIGSDDLFLALFWTSDTMQWRGIPNISAIQHIKNNQISARQKKEVVKCVILDARGILRHLENALHCGGKKMWCNYKIWFRLYLQQSDDMSFSSFCPQRSHTQLHSHQSNSPTT